MNVRHTHARTHTYTHKQKRMTCTHTLAVTHAHTHKNTHMYKHKHNYSRELDSYPILPHTYWKHTQPHHICVRICAKRLILALTQIHKHTNTHRHTHTDKYPLTRTLLDMKRRTQTCRHFKPISIHTFYACAHMTQDMMCCETQTFQGALVIKTYHFQFD